VSRVPLKSGDLAIGQPLRWDVFDQHGRLVLARGRLIESAADLERLLRVNHVRELDLRLDVPTPDDSAASRGEVRLSLEETRIQPGAMMQIQSSLDAARYAVRLVGYLKGKSVIVTNPVQEGALVYLKEGQAFVARIFSGKFVYAFPCDVLASAVKPYAYLHLSYPGEVIGVNIRKGERVRLRSIAAFESEDGRRGSGVIVDMSCGGVLFVSKSPDVVVGRRLALKFKLTVGTMEYVLDLPGQVRSVRAHDDEPELGVGYGVQFAGISPEDNLLLSSFVFQQIAENRLS